jgi:hypothetical protein
MAVEQRHFLRKPRAIEVEHFDIALRAAIAWRRDINPALIAAIWTSVVTTAARSGVKLGARSHHIEALRIDAAIQLGRPLYCCNSLG